MEYNSDDKILDDWKEAIDPKQSITQDIFSLVIDRCREGKYTIECKDGNMYLLIQIT